MDPATHFFRILIGSAEKEGSKTDVRVVCEKKNYGTNVCGLVLYQDSQVILPQSMNMKIEILVDSEL